MTDDLTAAAAAMLTLALGLGATWAIVEGGPRVARWTEGLIRFTARAAVLVLHRRISDAELMDRVLHLAYAGDWPSIWAWGRSRSWSFDRFAAACAPDAAHEIAEDRAAVIRRVVKLERRSRADAEWATRRERAEMHALRAWEEGTPEGMRNRIRDLEYELGMRKD